MVLTRRAAERAEDPHTGVPSLRVPASPRETFIPQTLADDNDLQIADNTGSRYLWDPSEPVATRPLVWLHGGSAYSYAHDGNKNVSEVVDANGTVTAHYEYAPFGDVTVAAGSLHPQTASVSRRNMPMTRWGWCITTTGITSR